MKGKALSKTDLYTSFKTIQTDGIGGTNLLYNSNFSQGLDGWYNPLNSLEIIENNVLKIYNRCKEYNGDEYSVDIRLAQSKSRIHVPKNKIYVISGEFRTDSDLEFYFNYNFFVNEPSGSTDPTLNDRMTTYRVYNNKITKEWNRIILCGYHTKAEADVTLMIGIVNRNLDVNVADYTLYARNLKWEEGTIATAWSPSPMDLVYKNQLTNVDNFINQFSANDDITYAIKNRKPEEICGADEAIVVCTNENAVSLALKSLESGRLEIDETTNPEIVEEMKNLLGDELFNELAVQSVSTLELQPQLSEKEQLKQAIDNYYRQKEMLSIDKMMPDILSEDKLIEEK